MERSAREWASGCWEGCRAARLFWSKGVTHEFMGRFSQPVSRILLGRVNGGWARTPLQWMRTMAWWTRALGVRVLRSVPVQEGAFREVYLNVTEASSAIKSKDFTERRRFRRMTDGCGCGLKVEDPADG